VFIVWTIALLVFVAYPLYARRLNVKHERVGLIVFDFGRGGLQLILWGVCLLVLIVLAVSSAPFGWGDVLRWGLATLFVVLIVSIDLGGSTPLLKSGLHRDRLFEVTLDTESCTVCGTCERVCPRGCFQVDRRAHATAIPGAARCVQCGACVVQCPADALFFRGPQGQVILPETVRKFKLNLMGHRPTAE
jgi:NAD-dependent dihydropyrimidine dehydrogenase PreA subunit